MARKTKWLDQCVMLIWSEEKQRYTKAKIFNGDPEDALWSDSTLPDAVYRLEHPDSLPEI